MVILTPDQRLLSHSRSIGAFYHIILLGDKHAYKELTQTVNGWESNRYLLITDLMP